MMESIKAWVKKCKWIVRLYESAFEAYWPLQRRAKKIKKRILYLWYHMTTKVKFHYGEKNPDRIFFVIPFDNPLCGLYSFVLIHLPVLEYADKRNYIPIIDFKNTYSYLMQDECQKDRENSWEYYYEQAGGQYSLEEVYQSRHVIRYISKAYWIDMLNVNRLCPLPADEWARWSSIVAKYLRLVEPLQLRIREEKSKLFPQDGKILGVGIRAEFRSGRMRGSEQYISHPKVPSCEELLVMVEDRMKEWDYQYIFVSSDDREYLNQFIEHFGDRCCFVDRRLGHWFENGEPVVDPEQRNIEFKNYSIKNKTEDYIVETYLLAACDSLYATLGSGSQYAYLVNGGKYKYTEFYDKGIYE